MDRINVIKINEREFIVDIPLGSTIVTFKLEREYLRKLDQLINVIGKSRSRIIRDLVKTFITLMEALKTVKNDDIKNLTLIMRIQADDKSFETKLVLK
ncbi:MAG: ribbon-helix-helix protein, CopG family [Candidatus Methanomethylicia archaeon]